MYGAWNYKLQYYNTRIIEDMLCTAEHMLTTYIIRTFVKATHHRRTLYRSNTKFKCIIYYIIYELVTTKTIK